MAVEDKRFYQHPGFDLLAIGAVVNDIKAGALVEGGSTITQQLAKNVYFTQGKRVQPEDRRGFHGRGDGKGIYERRDPELYLNSIYFGNGYTCVKEASRDILERNPWK